MIEAKFGASATGSCQMLTRKSESWRMGQRPNSSDQGALFQRRIYVSLYVSLCNRIDDVCRIAWVVLTKVRNQTHTWMREKVSKLSQKQRRIRVESIESGRGCHVLRVNTFKRWCTYVTRKIIAPQRAPCSDTPNSWLMPFNALE